MSGFEKKNESPELRKFKGKLYTLYMYEMSEFVEKLNLQNFKNSTGNRLHYIRKEFLDL